MALDYPDIRARCPLDLTPEELIAWPVSDTVTILLGRTPYGAKLSKHMHACIVCESGNYVGCAILRGGAGQLPQDSFTYASEQNIVVRGVSELLVTRASAAEAVYLTLVNDQAPETNVTITVSADIMSLIEAIVRINSKDSQDPDADRRRIALRALECRRHRLRQLSIEATHQFACTRFGMQEHEIRLLRVGDVAGAISARNDTTTVCQQAAAEIGALDREVNALAEKIASMC